MARIRFEKATKKHAIQIAFNIRKEDRAELSELGYEPIPAMMIGIEQGDFCEVMYCDDISILIWGGNSVDGYSIPWMISTNSINLHFRTFMRVCKKRMLEKIKDYDMLGNYVDVRNTRSVKWLEYMGFKMLETVPYGKNGNLFYRFVWRR